MNRFRVSPTLARKLDELGLSPTTVLRYAGLPDGLFDQERIRVDTEELSALHLRLALPGATLMAIFLDDFILCCQPKRLVKRTAH